jgi:thiamine pyrophosphokinase
VRIERDHYHYLSLIPLTRRVTGVRTRGLRFPLSGETLHQERGRGVANEYRAGRATIAVESGLLMVIEATRVAAGC